MITNHAKCALIIPAPYEGTVTPANSLMSKKKTWPVIEAAKFHKLPPLIFRCGDWCICHDGIYCLSTTYHIEKERFDEINWIAHVTEKTWVDKADFTKIFRIAKEMLELGMI